ncbi:MAG: DUF2141 domain-containing protein [Armatimonadota bacterium]
MVDPYRSRGEDTGRWVVESIVVPGMVSGELLRPETPDPLEAHPLRIETTLRPPKPPSVPTPGQPWLLSTRSAAPDLLGALWRGVRSRYAFDPARIEVPPGVTVETFPKIEVRVIVPKVRRRRGVLVASLFAGPKGFPADGKRAVAVASFDIERIGETDPLVVAMPGIDPGAVAVALLHDENGNGRLDTTLGFPTEGFGFSGAPKVRFGPPRYEACRFLITTSAPNRDLEIPIIYL